MNNLSQANTNEDRECFEDKEKDDLGITVAKDKDGKRRRRK